jgi:hypothetical protein
MGTIVPIFIFSAPENMAAYSVRERNERQEHCMVREPDDPDEWCVLETYTDRIAAEADAGFLRSEKLAAKVEVISDFPGQDRGIRLWVDAALVHRARWLLKLSSVSDAELEYLATGKLPGAKEE